MRFFFSVFICSQDWAHLLSFFSGKKTEKRRDFYCEMETSCCTLCSIVPFFVAAIAIRIAYVFYWTGKPLESSASNSVRTLIILGSGMRIFLDFMLRGICFVKIESFCDYSVSFVCSFCGYTRFNLNSQKKRPS